MRCACLFAKGPVVHARAALLALARDKGVRYLHESAVMDGVPQPNPSPSPNPNPNPNPNPSPNPKQALAYPERLGRARGGGERTCPEADPAEG